MHSTYNKGKLVVAEKCIRIKVYLSNYVTKLDLKNVTGLDTSKLVVKSDLASLKAEKDKIDVHKLKTFPDNLRKLSNVVNYEVVKKSCAS